ncbi:MAG: hypothetical protein KKF89_04165, partial [Nanoarchaeota archaeon]|nr:hypothetical protein [Nanoarchaeota archaeon]
VIETYSFDGELLNRNNLFSAVLNETLYYQNFVGADFDYDGKIELAVVHAVLDKNIFYVDRYNSNSYHSFISVIDDDGTVLSTYKLKGYMINDLVIGTFGHDKPIIIAKLEDTWSTMYEGYKIIALDFEGKELLM